MENDTENTSKTDKPWLWKKGFCPNPGGRPKGKSMKDYVREYLSKMTDEERDKWLEGLPKEIIWRMSEGNPHSTTDITSGDKPIPLLGIMKENVPDNLGNSEGSKPEEKN